MSGNKRQQPLYKTIKKDIQGKISSGEWTVGSVIPSEHELLEQYDVARMTVHRALRELTAEGWLVRKRGAGTFVAEHNPQTAIFGIRSIAQEVRGKGLSYSNRVLAHHKEMANDTIAELLELPVATVVFHSLILHFQDKQPIQLENRYVSPALAPDYLDNDIEQTPPYEYLIKAAPLSDAQHRIKAKAADSQDAELLQIERGSPCLQITRRTWSSGKPVSFVKLTHPGDLYELDSRFFG
ncbi:histidine utilization repressor [Kiloniella sp. b19]|uniref:histidine utilization repressor n=1 Tax=Kiloniella sp. GXU_MW_B19 TaxID=3141326 RepID=UPI0031E3A806